MEILKGVVQDCRECVSRNDYDCVLPGEGSLEASVLVVGAYSGPAEVLVKGLVAGEKGVELVEWITRMGLSFDRIWLTNILKCGVSPERVPTKAESVKCRVWLEDEVSNMSNLRAIVTMGGRALKGVTKDDFIPSVAHLPCQTKVVMNNRRFNVYGINCVEYVMTMENKEDFYKTQLAWVRTQLAEKGLV